MKKMITLTKNTKRIKGYLINNIAHKNTKVYFRMLIENKTLKLALGDNNNYMFAYVPHLESYVFRKDVVDKNGAYKEYTNTYTLEELIKKLENKVNYILS